MSYQTWQSLYYPVPASEATSDDLKATRHSLRKWTGLREDTLIKHGLRSERRWVCERRINSDDSLEIDDKSCALCHIHLGKQFERPCLSCPVSRLRNDVACDETTADELYSPYTAFISFKDPEPMIKLLTEVEAALESGLL